MWFYTNLTNILLSIFLPVSFNDINSMLLFHYTPSFHYSCPVKTQSKGKQNIEWLEWKPYNLTLFRNTTRLLCYWSSEFFKEVLVFPIFQLTYKNTFEDDAGKPKIQLHMLNIARPTVDDVPPKLHWTRYKLPVQTRGTWRKMWSSDQNVLYIGQHLLDNKHSFFYPAAIRIYFEQYLPIRNQN